MVRPGRARRLDGQELEAGLVPPVLLEQAGPLHRDLDVVADLGLAGEAGEARGQGLGDVRVQQLLGAVHDAEAADAKEAAGRGEAAGVDDAADAGHCLGVAAGVVEGELELEGEAVLARAEQVGRRDGGGVVVGEDLGDLVQDLVVLVERVAARGAVAGDAQAGVLGRDAEGGAGLALELDDDGADMLVAAEREHDLAADDVQVRVELGRVVQHDADRHGARRLPAAAARCSVRPRPGSEPGNPRGRSRSRSPREREVAELKARVCGIAPTSCGCEQQATTRAELTSTKNRGATRSRELAARGAWTAYRARGQRVAEQAGQLGSRRGWCVPGMC